MLKSTILLLGLTLCLASLTLPFAKPTVARASRPMIQSVLAGPTDPTLAPVPTIQPVATEAAVAALTQPTEPSQPQEDPWYAPLRAHVEESSDAFMDRPHTHRGLLAGEPPLGREMRLNHFTEGVLRAVRARAGELAQFGPDAAWQYAVTLVCIAHRETRIASNPSKLGDQDGGRAAGPWQIWERRDHADRFSADTALDMLIKEPASSWALPAKHPWTKYPECSKWLAAHPAPGGVASEASAP